MIVVVIIGVLSALAIPRFSQASKKAKKTEARLMLKRIYQAAQMCYMERGGYPPCDEYGRRTNGGWWQFNNASTPNTNWNGKVPGATVDPPSGLPRFTYVIRNSGTTFRAEAWSWTPDSYDGAMVWEVRDMRIDQDGNITYGGAKPTW